MDLEALLKTRVINAAGTLTRLGGSIMSQPVIEAINRAANCSFNIFELQAEASRVIARHTGAEAAMVTTGASSALTLAAAACIARFDVAKMEQLPDITRIPRHEIVIALTHRNGYDHAFRLAGAKLVTVGTNDRGADCGIRGVEPWEYEAAIDVERTAAIAFVAHSGNMDELPRVVEVARRNKIPLIVDAAAQLPPKTNLRAFIEIGCDLVAFSGGKAIGGPQASGILCGKRDLIASAVLQQQDMDVFTERRDGKVSWRPPEEFVPKEQLPLLKGAVPRHGLGRGFKAGKEEIVGLVTAVEIFAQRDEETWRSEMYDRLYQIIDASAIGLVAAGGTEILNEHEGPIPVAEISFASKEQALKIVDKLLENKPAVHVELSDVGQGKLTINLAAVREEDDEVIIQALRKVALEEA